MIVLRWFLTSLLSLLMYSLRVRVISARDGQSAFSLQEPCIILFWHGAMLLPWWYFRKKNFTALISKSKDGDSLAYILNRWKYRLIRGSSSHGGREAMDAMHEAALEGHTLCITPDGPRGPKGILKMGAVRAAQKSGLPIVFVGVKLEKKKILRSWDSFAIPFPFSGCTLTLSEPIIIPNENDLCDLEPMRKEIEERMLTYIDQ